MMRSENLKRISRSLARPVPSMLLLMALVASWAAAPASADKVYYKNGKVIEGVVQEEFPGRVVMLFEGRKIVIPRTRIEKVEIDSAQENVQSAIEKAKTAIERGDAREARMHLENAQSLGAAEGEFATELASVSQDLEKLEREGTSEQRRRKAAELLRQASEQFDRIQMAVGLDLLLQALALDNEYEPAHEMMADYMRDQRPPPVELAVEYFSEHVNPQQLSDDHPVVSLLPEAYGRIVQQLKTASSAEDIQVNTQRLMKMGSALADHPEWSHNATEPQAALINKGPEGILAEQVDESLTAENFDVALHRLEAWGQPDANPEIEQRYVRTWIGFEELDRAQARLEKIREENPELPWASRAANALTLYQSALEAVEQNRQEDARSILDRLFAAREDLLPEIYSQVARSKVVYDREEAENLRNAGDYVGAADLMLRISDYSVDQRIREEARRAFLELAPDVTYAPTFVWNVDGQEVPLHQHSTDLVRSVLGREFNLRFNDKSPFAMKIVLFNTTANNSGQRLSKAAQRDRTFELDLFEPDDAVTGMRLETRISHPANEQLFEETTQFVGPHPEATMAREDPVLGKVFFDIKELASIDQFLENDFAFYLPPELAELERNLRL